MRTYSIHFPYFICIFGAGLVVLLLLFLFRMHVTTRLPLSEGGDQYLVVLSTSNDRAVTLLKGEGWNVDASFYSRMGSKYFANVLGPFPTLESAQRVLKELQSANIHPNAYITNAGRSMSAVTPWKEANIPPALLAAFVNSLDVRVNRNPGSQNPCQPQQPFYSLTVRQIAISSVDFDEKTGLHDVSYSLEEVPIGQGLTMIERTGEINQMNACFE